VAIHDNFNDIQFVVVANLGRQYLDVHGRETVRNESSKNGASEIDVVLSDGAPDRETNKRPTGSPSVALGSIAMHQMAHLRTWRTVRARPARCD